MYVVRLYMYLTTGLSCGQTPLKTQMLLHCIYVCSCSHVPQVLHLVGRLTSLVPELNGMCVGVWVVGVPCVGVHGCGRTYVGVVCFAFV